MSETITAPKAEKRRTAKQVQGDVERSRSKLLRLIEDLAKTKEEHVGFMRELAGLSAQPAPAANGA